MQISEEKHQSGSRRVKRKSGGAECDTWVVLIQAGKQQEGRGGQEGQQQQHGCRASLLQDDGFTTRPKGPRLRTLAEDRPLGFSGGLVVHVQAWCLNRAHTSPSRRCEGGVCSIAASLANTDENPNAETMKISANPGSCYKSASLPS